MPPSYKAPGPIGFVGYANANHGGGYGGGFANQFFQAQDPTGLYQNRLQLTGLEGQIQGDLSNQRFVQQGQLQAQRAQLDAWEYNQQVTSQEAMQLRQDQNSISAIEQDNTMTPLEKQQAKLRIKTRIDWVSERQKRDLQQAQVQQAQAHAQMFTQLAKLDESKNEFYAQKQAGKVTYEPTPEAAIKIGDQLRDEGYGDLEKSNPKAWEEEVRKRALEQGDYRVMIPDKNGLPTLAKAEFQPGGSLADMGARSSTRGGKGPQPGGILGGKSPMEIVAQMAKERGADGSPLHPELQTTEGRIAEAKKIAAAHDEGVAAASPQAKKQPMSRGEAIAVKGNFAAQIEDVRKRADLDPTTKGVATGLINEAQRLLLKYKGEDGMPDRIHERYIELKHQFDVITRKAGSVAQPATPAQPQRRSLVGDLRRMESGINNAIDKYGTQASQAIDSNVKGLFNYLGGGQ